MQFLPESHLNRRKIFVWSNFLKMESEPMFGFPHTATCNYTALKIHTFIGPMLLECKIRKTNCILMYYSSVKFAHRTPKKTCILHCNDGHAIPAKSCQQLTFTDEHLQRMHNAVNRQAIQLYHNSII